MHILHENCPTDSGIHPRKFLEILNHSFHIFCRTCHDSSRQKPLRQYSEFIRSSLLNNKPLMCCLGWTLQSIYLVSDPGFHLVHLLEKFQEVPAVFQHLSTGSNSSLQLLPMLLKHADLVTDLSWFWVPFWYQGLSFLHMQKKKLEMKVATNF